jgi:hypothetical protein
VIILRDLKDLKMEDLFGKYGDIAMVGMDTREVVA